MKKSYFFLLVFAVVALVGCGNSQQHDSSCCHSKKVKNVIFMIGDGMGLNQMYAGMTANGGHLNFERCTHTGLVKTFSASNYITDSSASGTALATGHKTKNGMVGMNPDSVPVYSILSSFEEAGRPTGLVVTVRITHATPAAFYAHQVNRGMYDEIAVDLLHSGVDFFAGGARSNFEMRKDSVNLTDSLKDAGYNIVYSLDSVKAPVLLPFGAMLADVDLPSAPERGNYLPEAVDLAIKSLDAKDEGFFLMVEGSQIDYQGHGNNTEGIINEVLDFDQAIKVALDFAEKDGETLVVVTADHETGGFTIMDGCYKDSTLVGQFNTNGHTGTMVPVYAFGAGAEEFTGFFDNTELQAVMRRLSDVK